MMPLAVGVVLLAGFAWGWRTRGLFDRLCARERERRAEAYRRAWREASERRVS